MTAARWLGHRAHLVAAVLVVIPVLLSPVVLGLDVPWHTLFASVIHHDSADRYLGYLDGDFRMSTYATLYLLVDVLANLVSELRAMQLIAVATACAWVVSCAHLLAAFGRDRRLAIACAPLAYSITYGYGFVAFWLALPVVLWQWTAVRRYQQQTGRGPLAAVLGCGLFLGYTHAVAAVMGLFGSLLIAGLARPGEGRAAMRAAAVAILGAVPTVVALASMGAAPSAGLPAFLGDASWWQRLMAQPFSGPVDSLVGLGRGAVWGAPSWVSVGYLTVLVGLLMWCRGGDSRSRPAVFVAAALATVYFFTPVYFDWPREMVGAQARLVPVVVVMAVVAAAPARLSGRQLGAAAVLGAVVLGAIAAGAVERGREARDMLAVIDQAEPRQLTLALIEQPTAPDRFPAGPFRHAGAYLVTRKGGMVSGTPSWARTQPWVPVTLRKAPPPAPPPGYPRDYRPWIHDGWQQVLIRDRDPQRRHRYFEPVSGAARIAQRGRWRLYRLAP